ncbi:MAG: orotate phosphoribosyltransferase, partial [Acidobacteriota bacterium]
MTESRPADDRSAAAEVALDPILSRLREAIAFYLWRLEAVRVSPDEPFRLASGNRSPIYVNCRRVISEPGFMQLWSAAALLICEGRGLEIDAIAGGETAGIPFAAYLAPTLARPMVYVRKKAKGYGIASRVEGHLDEGSRVLLVEDLITDGGSKVGFLEAIRAAGGEVHDALVLFDRQQGGSELLAGHGTRLHAVADRATTLAAGQAAGVLSAAASTTVEEYFADPAGWHR